MTVTRFPRAPAEAAPAADASFVVNTLTGRAVSIGRLAAQAIGWSSGGQDCHALDAAMPAVNQLRRFARTDLKTEHVLETLVFWGQKGTVSAQCRLEHIAGNGAEPLVRVTVVNIAELMVQRAVAERSFSGSELTQTKMETVEKQASAQDTLRDDRATLQLIAQRIEDGMKLTAVAQSPPPEDPHDMNSNRSGDKAAESGLASREQCPAHQHSTIDPFDTLVPVTLEANDNSALKFTTPAVELQQTTNSADAVAPIATGPDLEVALDQSALAALFAKTAHDIKTPLSAISAASEIIRDERLGPSGNERYRTYAADIHASARHALAIVDRLMKMPPALEALSSARANSQQAQDVQPSQARATPELNSNVSVDLNALISGCATELRPLMDAQNLALTMRLDASGPRVLADALGLKQSLLNVLTNAMKFTAPGGAIHIETETLPTRGARLSVRDTGRGMTKGAIARHLEMDAAAPTATGLGFGLPQIKDFARKTGAALGIDSTLGRGTTVSLTFTI